MDATKPDTLTELRFLHYPASENNESGTRDTWRAGAHTDFGALTLLFQQDGGDGLEICPGRESHMSRAKDGMPFFPVRASSGPIIVNIGDMLSEFGPNQYTFGFIY